MIKRYGYYAVEADLLGPDSVVYSFGVGNDIEFEKQICGNHGSTVHSFDPTPSSIKWIEGKKLPPNMSFHPYGIGTLNGWGTFKQAIEDYGSSTMLYRPWAKSFKGPVLTLSMIALYLVHRHIDVLKLDIEGAEFAVLCKLPLEPVVDQITLEYHHQFPETDEEFTEASIERMQARGYDLSDRKDREVLFIRRGL